MRYGYQFPAKTLQTVYKPASLTEPFALKFVTKRITRCQGCKQNIREDDDNLPLPPYDLIIARMEQRPFVTGDGFVKVPSKMSNSHYHLRWECLQLADPTFNPANIVTPSDVRAKLTTTSQRILTRKVSLLSGSQLTFIVDYHTRLLMKN